MPRGIPRNKNNGINKMEGVRRAMSTLGWDAAPKDIQSFLKSEFAIDMEPSMISNYKSSIKSSGKSKLIRKPGRSAGARPAEERVSLDDLRAVKSIVDKVGADKVRRLAEVLGK
jgi:hypothetical protein